MQLYLAGTMQLRQCVKRLSNEMQASYYPSKKAALNRERKREEKVASCKWLVASSKLLIQQLLPLQLHFISLHFLPGSRFPARLASGRGWGF